MTAFSDMARQLKLPTGWFLDGTFRPAAAGAMFQTRAPYTGEVIADLRVCTSADVDAAVASARRAFEAGTWSGLRPSERQVVLSKRADLIMEDVEQLAVMGVRATGNAVIVKPAEDTSLTALRLAELAIEAGLPQGVLNVITGMGPEAGEPLGRQMDVDAITFTGSTEVGRRFLEYSARSNTKEVGLEMGGKSAAVVLSDARDIERIAETQANAIFWNMGENCTANSRIIAHKDVHDDLVAALARQAPDWRLGDPLDPATRNGPLVSRTHYDKVAGLVETGKTQGARLVTGGTGAGRLMFEPTVFAEVTEGMDIFPTEIFGAVVAVTRAESDDAAIDLANATRYGLAATLYTADVSKAHRYARKLKAGTVSVNTYSEGDIATPFGRFKQSGFGGRDNAIQAHEKYTELKTIWIDLTA